ncbi:MAG: nitroreductase family protein [Gemmatimonadota bacterium]|nr:nitroreductase family protein [Gemmatimonadota bacterium]
MSRGEEESNTPDDTAIAPGAPSPFVPLHFVRLPIRESLTQARSFFDEMNQRRTTRQFSSEPVPRELIELAVRTAGTAPSGAHQQPWTFVAVSDTALKCRIREAAEEEERANYAGRMPPDWLNAVAALGTDQNKPHLTDAPWVVVVFRHLFGLEADGSKRTYYYTQESVGIAVGLFISAIHHMGLVTLTHTPSPMGFLATLLERPENEKAFLLMPVGYPASNARVPDLQRRALEEISVWK